LKRHRSIRSNKKKKGGFRIVVHARLFSAALSAAAAGCAASPAHEAITPEELRVACGLPARCSQRAPCEGRTVTVQGRVDDANVFPGEKFVIVDPASHRILEVAVEAPDAASIFARLRETKGTAATARVRGAVHGFDAPITGSCSREIRLDLRGGADLELNHR
jgi:hypothetical protein